MKILYLIEELGGGGKERRLVELLKGLSANKNFELHLVLSKSTNAYPEINQFPITIHHLSNFSNVALIRQYFLILKKIKPDVLHTWSHKTSFYISLLKPLFTFKFIAGFIGDTFGFRQRRALIGKNFIFKGADIIVSNSLTGLKAYNVPENKGRVIPNGFDPKRISKKKINKLEEMGIKTPINIVMLANVSPYKNYKLFVEIAEQLTKSRKDITFISIGKVLPEFESFAKPFMNNNHPQIKFLGFRSDASELIKDCDLGLLCTYSEGISNAVIELMANGVPVISNDLKGGTREIISNNVDGYICKDEEVVSKLQHLLNDPNLKYEISKNAIHKVTTEFSLSKMVAHYIEIYTS